MDSVKQMVKKPEFWVPVASFIAYVVAYSTGIEIDQAKILDLIMVAVAAYGGVKVTGKYNERKIAEKEIEESEKTRRLVRVAEIQRQTAPMDRG